MNPNRRLEWALVVATYDRLEVLKVCVRMALTQTRPPSEVIIVDAGPQWRHGAEAIGGLFGDDAPPLRYMGSDTPSLTVQRNIGADAATADVLFMIDDDSFMHPDCAAEIMAVYEADTAGAVAGVQAQLSPANPANTLPAEARKTASNVRRDMRILTTPWLKPLRKLVVGWLFMVEPWRRFIPYDRTWRDPEPRTLSQTLPTIDAIRAQRLFHGCRMTFRREAVLAEPFDDVLRFYCPYEDMDGSYRIGRRGMLLLAQKAMLHHFQSDRSRLKDRPVTILSCLNLAFLLRRHAQDQRWARRRYLRRMAHHVVTEMVKETISLRWRFVKTRAVLRAVMMSGRIFRATYDELRVWYPDMQKMTVSGKI